LISKICCYVQLVEDGNVDWSEGIFVPPGGAAAGTPQDIAKHGTFLRARRRRRIEQVVLAVFWFRGE
jgi:hypothetical protein